MNDENPNNIEGALNEIAGAGDNATTPNNTQSPPPQPQQPAPQRKGNEVFAKQQQNQGGVQSLTREEYAKQELNIEIPIDVVPLPSKGRVYSEEHPLHLAETVEYRAMTAREEDLLLSRALIKKGTVITELIKSCLINKQINVNSLLSGDRNALMIAIRISGYGVDYETKLACPECSFTNNLKVNLASLAIKPLGIEPVAPGQNLFAINLPMSKKDVEFKFLTGDEEEKILRDAENRKKRGIFVDNMITSRLQSAIVSVNNDTRKDLITKYANYLPAGDSRLLREYMDKHEPGVNMDISFECENPDCNCATEVTLPIGTNFFWPGTQR